MNVNFQSLYLRSYRWNLNTFLEISSMRYASLQKLTNCVNFTLNAREQHVRWKVEASAKWNGCRQNDVVQNDVNLKTSTWLTKGEKVQDYSKGHVFGGRTVRQSLRIHCPEEAHVPRKTTECAKFWLTPTNWRRKM